MTRFLPKESIEKVVATFLEELNKLLLRSGKRGYHLIILDPLIPYREGQVELLKENILFEISINKEKWQASNYKKVAEDKAIFSLREKCNSGEGPAFLFRTGDIKWKGAVYYKGLIVSLSGFKELEDQEYALAIAKKCENEAIANYTQWNKTNGLSAYFD